MSIVNPSDLNIINNIDDVIDTYTGAGEDIKAGIEVELAFFDPKTMKPMSVPQNKVLKNASSEKHEGDWVRNEPTAETLEVNSIAENMDGLKRVLKDTQTKIKIVEDTARGIGVKRSYFQDLPDKTAQELLSQIVNVDRYQAFFNPPRQDMANIAAYFSVCKSNQVSVSYKNPDHMLQNIRRLYYLAPFLFMLTDNSSGFIEGKKDTKHAGMNYRAFLNDEINQKGTYPSYLFTANTGEDYLRSHIEHVMNNPLYVYYDKKGELNKIPSGIWKTFNGLKDKGLNIASNFHLAESTLWPDVKIAPLRDSENTVIGHRYEARMFGVGIHQHQTAAIITAALAFNHDLADQIDHLLNCFGFDPKTPNETLKNLKASYLNARNHDNHFFNIAYGNGEMSDFARKFALTFENAFTDKNFDDELTPLLAICNTGCTDAKVNRALFPTLEKAIKFQQDYDPLILQNPNTCAHLLFENDLKRSGHTECSQTTGI